MGANVTRGMDRKIDFDKILNKQQKRMLLKIMARIMEAGYRRGVEQAVYLKDSGQPIVKDVHSYRYGKSLDKSPSLFDGRLDNTSIERLMMEHGASFMQVGLYDTEA